jgi:cyclopropane fatty-acyl-phospholipid synthase-like methyltransferase
MEKNKEYKQALSSFSVIRNPENYLFYLQRLFRNVDFFNQRVLDIGGGYGLISYYAAFCGAREVICLEPEAAGSFDDVSKQFAKMDSLLSGHPVQFCAESLQDFDPIGQEPFEIVIIHNAINHLDEEACSVLHISEKAQKIYSDLFAKIASMSSLNSSLIISDCSRHNIFPFLGLKNPFVPTISWRLHQSPYLWAKLLRKAGFEVERIRWHAFSGARSFGTFFLANSVAAFLTTSQFYIDSIKK